MRCRYYNRIEDKSIDIYKLRIRILTYTREGKIMSELDPNGKLQKTPVLSPETLSPKKEEASVVSDAVSPEQVSTKNHRGMKILIGSLGAVLLAGAVTLAVLAKAGAFSKEKEENTNPETTSESIEAEGTESEETSASDTETEAQHLSIVSLSQVTDKQLEFMDEYARDAFMLEGIPDKVQIDGMYYLGMLRQILVYTDQAEYEKDMVQLVYQIQVTDNTGDKPVKRQFFWMYGFPNVYQDGTVDPYNTEPMWYTLCFDNWTVSGSLNLHRLIHHAENMYSLVENGIDFSLVQPFEDGEEEETSLLKSLDQITPAMEQEFQNGAELWLNLAGISSGAKLNGVVVDNVEYAGLALALSYNKTMNCVYVIYKLDISKQNGSEPESRSIYWYVGLGGIYEGGEIQTCLSQDTAHDHWTFEDWKNDLASIEDVRECIQHREVSGWYYEDNLEGGFSNVEPDSSEPSTEPDSTDPAAETSSAIESC